MRKAFESCGLKINICKMYISFNLVVSNMPCEKLKLKSCEKEKGHSCFKWTTK